jgi:hypothetical protein
MNDQGWVKRPRGLRGIPAGVRADQMVEFRVGDDPAVHVEEAGNLAWGDGPGAISEFRPLVPAVPAGHDLTPPAIKHAHYFKSVAGLQTVDVYRVLELFGVTDQALGHAIKKLLVAGGRGAGKDIGQDVREAIDTLQRWQAMRLEDTTLRRA